MAKKTTAKKTESKKVEAPAKKMVKVMRFNVKDGERYPMEVEESEVLTDINGDVGLKDIILYWVYYLHNRAVSVRMTNLALAANEF